MAGLLTDVQAEGGALPGADEFLPALILLVKRANPPGIHSTLEFIQVWLIRSGQATIRMCVYVCMCMCVYVRVLLCCPFWMPVFTFRFRMWVTPEEGQHRSFSQQVIRKHFYLAPKSIIAGMYAMPLCGEDVQIILLRS